jgi:hypothetical protein
MERDRWSRCLATVLGILRLRNAVCVYLIHVTGHRDRAREFMIEKWLEHNGNIGNRKWRTMITHDFEYDQIGFSIGWSPSIPDSDRTIHQCCVCILVSLSAMRTISDGSEWIWCLEMKSKDVCSDKFRKPWPGSAQYQYMAKSQGYCVSGGNFAVIARPLFAAAMWFPPCSEILVASHALWMMSNLEWYWRTWNVYRTVWLYLAMWVSCAWISHLWECQLIQLTQTKCNVTRFASGANLILMKRLNLVHNLYESTTSLRITQAKMTASCTKCGH